MKSERESQEVRALLSFLGRHNKNRLRQHVTTREDIKKNLTLYPEFIRVTIRLALDLRYAIDHYDLSRVPDKKKELYEYCTQIAAAGFGKEAALLFNGESKAPKEREQAAHIIYTQAQKSLDVLEQSLKKR
jgi:hypothetical protein